MKLRSMQLMPLLALAALCACKSTAPYTVPAAAINTAVAAGFSLRQRAEGGCYAICAHGTVCNPRTGYCDPAPCGNCQSWEVCVETEVAWRCVVGGTPMVTQTRPGATTPPGEIVPGVGVSPATGTVPTLPPLPPATTQPGK